MCALVFASSDTRDSISDLRDGGAASRGKLQPGLLTA